MIRFSILVVAKRRTSRLDMNVVSDQSRMLLVGKTKTGRNEQKPFIWWVPLIYKILLEMKSNQKDLIALLDTKLIL